jgi:hypothetical protein
MTAHHTAQGIASLGRYGDDLIVHMNQEEVAGLQALAKQHGASLSINPHTGMPEAFSLGKVFKAILPVAAGFALGPGGFASGLFESGSFMGSALGTGLLVGGATAALTGNLGQGLMAGLGAYGGFGLSDVYSKMGGMSGIMGAGKSTAALNADILGKQGINTVGNSIIPVSKVPQVGNIGAAMEANVNNLASAFPKTQVIGGGYGTVGSPGIDFSNLGTSAVAGGNANIPLSLANTSKSALYNPSLADSFAAAGGKASQLYMPIGGAALAGVEPKDFYDEPLAAQEKQTYEQTGVDSMGRPTYGYVNSSAFNPYRTLNLSGPGPLKLAPPGYAEGGVVQPTIQTGGIRDLYGSSDNQAQALSTDGFGLGRLSNLANQQAMTTAKTLGYAQGGEVPDWKSYARRNTPPADSPWGAGTIGSSTDGGQTGTTYAAFDEYSPLQKAMMGITFMDSPGWRRQQAELPALNIPTALNINTGKQEPQMAKGGYLDGAGDGMSDSIPATIEGKQPARLADGEFVVPADVVSHLGNGSSKAGSKRLYAMMQKVRKARTGNPKQGKQINPNKYLMA